MSDVIYVSRKMGFWERIKLMFSRKYAAKYEAEQKAIIREMITTEKDAPIVWE